MGSNSERRLMADFGRFNSQCDSTEVQSRALFTERRINLVCRPAIFMR
jgi:hypothetical protein